MIWSALRDMVRRSILKDATEDLWTNEMLADFAGWALDAFAAHTALLKTVDYTGDGATYQFALPDDLYLTPDEFGLLYRFDPANVAQRIYMKPAFAGYDISPNDENSFTVWSDNLLELGAPVSIAETLVLKYYAYWPHPVDDADELGLPSWAYPAIAYDIGTHALTWRTLAEADVGSNRQKPDLGQPEQNAYRATQKWWIQLYERELARHPRQTRIRLPQ